MSQMFFMLFQLHRVLHTWQPQGHRGAMELIQAPSIIKSQHSRTCYVTFWLVDGQTRDVHSSSLG